MFIFVLNNFGIPPFHKITGDLQSVFVTIYNLATLGILAAGIILGIISLIGKRERSWMVWLFIIPSSLLILLLITFLVNWKPSIEKKEIAPTPDARIERIPIFFDDDGSPDGTTALLYLLSDPQAEVIAVSVSYGEAHPQIYIQHLGWVMDRFGYTNVPLGAGQDAPLAGDNAFPPSVREASDSFWGIANANAQLNYPVEDSAELMVRTILESDRPVTLFISGSLTNLALALRMNPEIIENISAVFIMGGAVYVPGNITGLLPESDNQGAEWNIYADPLAAREVFTSGLNLYLVPLDATNQVKLTRDDTRKWRKGGNLPDLAADIYDARMRDWQLDRIDFWDLMTAEIMLNPIDCVFTPLNLEVETAEGNTEGKLKIEDGMPNVKVCLEPNGEKIRSTLAGIFSSRR
jgi:purine nucleosidase/pyrimidine-specific ribonucleoside hydrolase